MTRVARGFVVLLVLLALGSPVFGQGSTTSTLSGVVVDTSGGVIPGASVVAQHNATGVTTSAISNAEGLFSFPGLNIGVYTVTVSLQGFKTFVASNVVLTSGVGATVRAPLEVGGLEEVVTVTSSSEIVQTQSSHVSTTINSNQITKLPLTTRSAMDFVTFMPGVSTPGGNRDSTINGLPRGTINITLDGVNVQDNTLRSTDGFFAIVSPRLDAVEEVTVTTAAQGADAGGQGAVQIKFVTRSGGNHFTGSGYHYYRNDSLNANTWFNNRDGVAKAKLLQNQGGFRAGGPIMLPGFNGHNKAFFFVNYEESRQPSDTTRNRTILNTGAQTGIFTYAPAGGGTQSINLLQLAAANGQLASTDPTIAKLLADIRTSTTKTGSIATIDPNLERFTYNLSVTSLRRYPTGRVDYNLTDNHRISSVVNYQYFTDTPDTLNNRDAFFPSFPVEAGQQSKRLGFSNSLRSTLTRNMVNEARVGYSWAPVLFFSELNSDMYTGSLANQQGFHINFPTIITALSAAGGGAPAPQSRNATALFIEDNVTWLKGAHSISTGVSFTQYGYWAKNSNLVPRITTGIVTGDPAQALFTPANFPGASAANITAAQNLYAFLTGRVTTITGDARLDDTTGQYAYMGTGMQRARLRESDFYLQDQWRLRPTLTINAGVRYGLQLPFYPTNSSYTTPTIQDVCGVSGPNGDNACNVFQPGVQPGKKPVFNQFQAGTRAYDIDFNNLAPSIGFAWTPAVPSGVLGKLMGRENDFVVRAGYTRAYSRPGMNDFTGFYNANPGVTIQAVRSDGNGNLVQGGVLPVLLRDTSRLGAAGFASTPVYPMTDIVTEDTNMFDPHIQVPSADSWQVGVQRSIGKDMSIEVRYVGTRGHGDWQTINYNEVDVIENGFTSEFRKAQANLAANIAAGRGATFAYTGAAGTQPLPTFLGYFNGQPASQASNAAAYSGANWTSATFQAFLAARNPNPIGMVSNGQNTGMLNSAALRTNAAAAGIPANFFVANPDLLGGANIRTNVNSSKYDSMQLEVRRRFAQGLQAQASYVFGHGYLSSFETLRQPNLLLRDVSTTNAPAGDVTHAFKLNAVYELPFGQNRRFGGSVNGVVERLIGGWAVGLGTRVQSGRLLDLGNVRLVGMTKDDVQAMFKLRFDDVGRKVWMLPQDVIDQTIAAFSVSATSPTGYAGAAPTGRYFAPANGPDCIEPDAGADYGACGARSVVVHGPMFRQTDLRFSKRTRLVGTTNFEFAIEMLNAFNQANFIPVSGFANPFGQPPGGNGFINATGNNINTYEVTQLTGTNTSRTIQIVSRINW